MSVTYHTLASGSAGNSALVRAGDTGVLIDIGMDERLIAHRLAATGHGWRDVNAVLLTHAHSDHWTDLSLAQIRRQKTLFYCHPDHELLIRRPDGEFAALRQAGLVRSFRDGEPIRLSELLTVTPVQVPHDSDPTFAFRIDGLSPEGQEWSLAHASDLGMCPQELFDVFRDVDLLALEFNHDVAMQRASGRPRRLIDRVLGDQGHLSNAQACAAVRRLLAEGTPGRLRHLVQLHLSRDCNTPMIAAAAARETLAGARSDARLTTAGQNSPSAILTIME